LEGCLFLQRESPMQISGCSVAVSFGWRHDSPRALPPFQLDDHHVKSERRLSRRRKSPYEYVQTAIVSSRAVLILRPGTSRFDRMPIRIVEGR